MNRGYNGWWENNPRTKAWSCQRSCDHAKTENIVIDIMHAHAVRLSDYAKIKKIQQWLGELHTHTQVMHTHIDQVSMITLLYNKYLVLLRICFYIVLGFYIPILTILRCNIFKKFVELNPYRFFSFFFLVDSKNFLWVL